MYRTLVILVALTACKKEEKSKAGAPDVAVKVSVDGKQVGTVDPAKAGAYAPLGSFLPAGAQELDGWERIEIEKKGGTLTFADPAKAHAGQVAAFFPGKGGISFGFFDPGDLAKKGAPVQREDGVLAVRVTTKQGMEGGQGGGDGEGGGAENEGERPAPGADLKITITGGPAGDVVFTGEELAKLPTSTAPIGDTDTPGWTLPQILEAAGVKPTGKVVVQGGENANLILDATDFDPEKATLFIKLNRSGQLRFRVFRKVGTTYEVAGELRGIVALELK